jgi:hypothetical protein
MWTMSELPDGISPRLRGTVRSGPGKLEISGLRNAWDVLTLDAELTKAKESCPRATEVSLASARRSARCPSTMGRAAIESDAAHR